VRPAQVQAALRRRFAVWGGPRRLRTDNGAPWGAAGGDLPTALALWLWGLDGAVVHNRPRRCTENGRVERTHGVLARWAEPHACASAEALQAALTAASAMQRETFPALGGGSRAAAYPAPAAGGRPYDPAREADLFDEHRVWARLARRTVRRRVDKVGRISVYNRPLGVGRARAGQEVLVGFDATAIAWVIRDAAGSVLRPHPAPELSREPLLALDVADRRPSRPQRPAPAEPHDRPAEGQPYTR
jgi:hypothetical protein